MGVVLTTTLIYWVLWSWDSVWALYLGRASDSGVKFRWTTDSSLNTPRSPPSVPSLRFTPVFGLQSSRFEAGCPGIMPFRTAKMPSMALSGDPVSTVYFLQAGDCQTENEFLVCFWMPKGRVLWKGGSSRQRNCQSSGLVWFSAPDICNWWPLSLPVMQPKLGGGVPSGKPCSLYSAQSILSTGLCDC